MRSARGELKKREQDEHFGETKRREEKRVLGFNTAERPRQRQRDRGE